MVGPEGLEPLTNDFESTVVVSKTLKTSVNTAVLRIPALRLLYLTGTE